MRLREFDKASGPRRPALICAPFSLHEANVADFALDHSLVAALLGYGLGPIFVTEWRSATSRTRFFSIDNLLADLNVAVDYVAAPVDLVGICQGGWMALVLTARFPSKVRKLVIAGAPVDLAAGASPMSRLAKSTPGSIFDDLVESGGGLFLGQQALGLWGPPTVTTEMILDILQIPEIDRTARNRRLARRFRRWHLTTVDLPGVYYLQVVNWLYRRNRLARGTFVALGERIRLSAVTQPVFLLAARGDDLVAVDQLMAAARHLGTASADVARLTVEGPHLSLFMGRETLADAWRTIAAWLGSDGRSRRRRTAKTGA